MLKHMKATIMDDLDLVLHCIASKKTKRGYNYSQLSAKQASAEHPARWTSTSSGNCFNASITTGMLVGATRI
jgi:hypothetical protein